MVFIESASDTLRRLGQRLRTARLSKDEPMGTFADRIGVSVPTLRAMERGQETVQIGYWAKALWALDRLEQLEGVLAPTESLLELARARARNRPLRQRASRKRS